MIQLILNSILYKLFNLPVKAPPLRAEKLRSVIMFVLTRMLRVSSSMANQSPYSLSDLDADGIILAGPVEMIRSLRTFRYFYNTPRVHHGKLKYTGDDRDYSSIQFGQVAGLEMYLTTNVPVKKINDMMCSYFVDKDLHE